MKASRLRSALLIVLSTTMLLMTAHPRSLFATKPVANRLHESRHPYPGRRLLTQHRQSPAITDESKRDAHAHNPAADRVATPVSFGAFSIVPVKVLDQLTKPAYLQFYRNPQHACSPPS